MTEGTPIREIKGIGEKTEKLFEKLNIYTAGDLLRYYPRGYDVYEEPIPVSEVEEGKICTVTGAIFGRYRRDLRESTGGGKPQASGDYASCQRSDRDA